MICNVKNILPSKYFRGFKWGNLAYVKAVRLLRVALAPLLCCFKTYLPICSLTLSSIPTSNYSPKLAPCIQSHYREVTRWKIFMEQKLRFWLSLGSTENTCILLPNKSILCIDSQIMIFQFSILPISLFNSILCVNFAIKD